jgi:hypothetical protein
MVLFESANGFLSQQKKNNRSQVLCSYLVPPFQLAQSKPEKNLIQIVVDEGLVSGADEIKEKSVFID